MLESSRETPATALMTLDPDALAAVAGGSGNEQVEINPPSSSDAWAPPNLPELSGPPNRLDWVAHLY